MPRTTFDVVSADAARLLGQQVLIERRHRGWTQRELAERAGTSPHTVSLIERGKSASVAFATVLNVAVVAGVQPYEETNPKVLRRMTETMARALALVPPLGRRDEKAVPTDF